MSDVNSVIFCNGIYCIMPNEGQPANLRRNFSWRNSVKGCIQFIRMSSMPSPASSKNAFALSAR